MACIPAILALRLSSDCIECTFRLFAKGFNCSNSPTLATNVTQAETFLKRIIAMACGYFFIKTVSKSCLQALSANHVGQPSPFR